MQVIVDNQVVFDDTVGTFHVAVINFEINAGVGIHNLKLISDGFISEEHFYGGYDKCILVDFREDDEGKNTGFYVTKSLTRIYAH